MINKNKPKIIFTDIDGTLTNSKREITNITKDIIKKIKEQGIYIILCSGRPNSYTIKKSIDSNASNIVISNNGSLIYNYDTNETIYKNEISKDNLYNIYKFCNENNIDCTLNGILNIYKNHSCDKDAIYIESFDKIDEPIVQIVIDLKKYTDIIKIQDYVKNSGVLEISNCSKSVLNLDKNANKYVFDIINRNYGKGNGIKMLLKYLNISKDESICFGDHINDYSMFKECGFAVAMKNGMKEIKDKADFITETNDNNGVAEFLKKYI